MYANPADRRENEVKIRLNDAELELLESLAKYNRAQRAVIARELLLTAITRITATPVKREITAA